MNLSEKINSFDFLVKNSNFHLTIIKKFCLMALFEKVYIHYGYKSIKSTIN